MRYFAKTVLRTPFCICLDWVPHWELRTIHNYINYPLNFLSPGGGGGESATFSTFQKMYLKHAKGPAKQWCSIKHHIWSEYYSSTPSPSLDWMVVHPHGWERSLKQAKGCAQSGSILIGDAWSTKEYQNSPSSPSPMEWDASPPLGLGKLCQHNFGHNSIVGESSNAGTIAFFFSA